jgi:hypothetical protein
MTGAPFDFIQANVIGTANVLNACLENSAVERIVHTSTSEVYGTAKYVPIDEKHPLQAQSPYAATKLAGDKICQVYRDVYGLTLADVRHIPEMDVALVEGSVCIQDHESVEDIKETRKKSKVVVALGSCASYGNITRFCRGGQHNQPQHEPSSPSGTSSTWMSTSPDAPRARSSSGTSRSWRTCSSRGTRTRRPSRAST